MCQETGAFEKIIHTHLSIFNVQIIYAEQMVYELHTALCLCVSV